MLPASCSPWTARPLSVRQEAARNMARKRNTCLHETLHECCVKSLCVSSRPFFFSTAESRTPPFQLGLGLAALEAGRCRSKPASAAEPFPAVCHLAAGIQHHRYHQSGSTVTSVRAEGPTESGKPAWPQRTGPQPEPLTARLDILPQRLVSSPQALPPLILRGPLLARSQQNHQLPLIRNPGPISFFPPPKIQLLPQLLPACS